ncbi:MAG: hypothetical protein ACTSR8_14365 [Promethearchaeota archaeon]
MFGKKDKHLECSSSDCYDDSFSNEEDNQESITEDDIDEVLEDMQINVSQSAHIDKAMNRSYKELFGEEDRMSPSEFNHKAKMALEGAFATKDIFIYNNNKEKKYSKHYFSGLKGFFELRLKLSSDLLEILWSQDHKTSDLINWLKLNISRKQLNLSDSEFIILNKMILHEDFEKYFHDLIEIVKFIIATAKVHKKIGASPLITYVAKRLFKRNITLFESAKGFPITVAGIYDHLSTKYDTLIPPRDRDNIQNRVIIGSRIKIHALRNIYNGLYFKDGKVQCPICRERGYTINTDISRLYALEAHHKGEEKYVEFSAPKLFHLFQKSKGDPLFLDKIIRFMESEHVILLCSNHHARENSKSFDIFRHLINYKDLFSLEPTLIHSLVRVSVKSYAEKRPQIKTTIQIRNIRSAVLFYIRKRYILEKTGLKVCPICREISIYDSLDAFDYHHTIPEAKQHSASELLRSSLTCEDIVKTLEQEVGGFICRNCHTIDKTPADISIVNQIYDDEQYTFKVFEDLRRFEENFSLIRYNDTIGAPLKKDFSIYDETIDYLIAIGEIIDSCIEASNKTIARHLSKPIGTVRHSMLNQFFNPFINIQAPSTKAEYFSKAEKKYTLTEYGKKALKLLAYFKNYFSHL